MGDAEVPPNKKRVAGRQISKDHPESDDDAPEAEMGTFQKASEEVMATRRIVKVRRNNPPPAASSTNPFAAIHLVPPEDTGAKASYPAEQPQTDAVTTTLEQNDNTQNTESTEIPSGISESDHAVETENECGKVENMPQESSDGADDAIEEKSLPADTSKESQNDGENIDHEALEDTDKKVEETQKEVAEANNREENVNVEKDTAPPDHEALEDTDKKVEETQKEAAEANNKEENVNDEKDTAPPAGSVSSFGQLSGSKNAFTSLTGSGFSTSSISFGSLSGDGFSFGKSGSSLFGNENASFSFGTGSASNGNSSLGFLNTSVDATNSSKPTMQEVPIETGEEYEKAVFNADAVIYEYLSGGWKERGKGELKLNISLEGSEKARLVMRAKGNYRLILNASLYSDMSLTNMDKRGVTFACVNSAGEAKDGLTTFALKFKDSSIVEEFRVAVTTHKGKKESTGVSKNPPEGSDD